MTAAQLIAGLGLAPHPEGGWYRELFRSAHRVQSGVRERSALTTIYYLLEADQVSRWHVVDSDESWHFHAGAALELSVYSPATRELVAYRLDSAAPTAQPVAVVPALAWQAARSTGDYSLVSCCVGRVSNSEISGSSWRWKATRPTSTGRCATCAGCYDSQQPNRVSKVP